VGAPVMTWAAFSQRRAGLPADTDTFRWVDESELTVDVFNDVAVLSLYRSRSLEEERALAQALIEAAPLRAIYLKRRPREAHRGANVDPEEVAPGLPLAGAPLDAVEAREAGAKFEIRPANGLSVGLYLDARDARAWVRANALGRRVLNLFAYTCGFGVAARLGGAERAVNVDLSRKVLDWGEHNFTLNGFAADRRDFIAGDCFDWLARFAKKREQFDLVVIDPPSFSNTAGRRFRAEANYGELVGAASRVVGAGGALLCCCNLESMGASRLEDQVRVGLGPRTFQTLAAFGASATDFAQPSALKVLAVRVS
jgi:23S rRNA (cytosine1962-C5)-methyltransferase